jgi:hypothetical protein
VSLKALAKAGAFVVCGKFRQTLYFLPFLYDKSDCVVPDAGQGFTIPAKHDKVKILCF